MDTKSRNKLLKLVAVVCLFTIGISGVFTTVKSGGKYFKNYYHTDEFRQEYYQFVDLLSLFELKRLTKEEVKKAITVSAEEVEEHRIRYGDLASQIANIEEQYRFKIEDAEGANEELADIYRAERDAKIADITENFKNDDHVRKKIVKEKEEQVDEYFHNIKDYRSLYNQYKGSFSYYLKNTETGKVVTNLAGIEDKPVEALITKQNSNFIQYYPSKDTGYLTGEEHHVYGYYNDVILEVYGGQTFEGVIAVPKSKAANSVVKGWSSDYEKRQAGMIIFAIASLAALILSFFLRRWASMPVQLERKLTHYYGRIPIDVRAVLAGLTAIFVVISFFLISDTILYFEIGETFVVIVLATFLMLALLFQGKWLLRDWEKGAEPDWKRVAQLQQEWKNSLISRLFELLRAFFLNRSIGVQMLILLSGVFLLGACTVVVMIQPAFVLVLFILVIVGILSLVVLLKFTGYFNKIVENTDELAAGRMGADLPIKGKSVLGRLAGNINVLKHGVKNSQNEQAKSERMKTELITNVSHDLRTPLTSIITYSELLKTPDLSEADRAAYIEVIDRKSKRLKVLIDDLFEASKMASGSVELIKERVDLVQLLQQALAEHNEDIDQTTLKFRVTNPETPVYSIVDGQKLWRVFDNLINNILKYSLENTRVFIALQKVDDKAMITFKNITKYELAESVDELFERFKRGDESRHTEGSGLGLAIAKSIVDLHEGKLDIEVDGDLFKVTITLDTV
ncbi:Signal transduction histidine kinase [Mesobacillus persicus]|uniref:histidine kinase n=1 Tax=Mesobacillus persicus TaxID=930146 RepID=A0A1H8GKU5_9BACI|nr:histidine kinase dimerization/phospho-acceptor domain-containing protein [Mesobacillus persicus]SEN44626.1 Signal transduction histidine kinase [Mesobacillus persicus]